MMNQDAKNFFLYVFPISVGLATYAWDQAFGALVIIPGLALAITGVLTVSLWMITRFQRGPTIAVWAGGNDTPKRLRPEHVLNELKKDDELIIVARTCKRWLVAEKPDVQKDLLDRLISAVERGARIIFVLQDLRVGLENFSEEEKKNLESDQKRTMKQFRTARNALRRNRANLTSKFRVQEVTNSMVVLKRSGEFVRLVQDIGMGFKEKAFVEINNELYVQELIDWLDDMVASAKDEKSHKIEMGWRDLQMLVAKSTDHLPLRANKASRFLHDSASRFLARVHKYDVPPPVSVQLEITNTCKTVCAMCTHYTLGGAKGELDKHEIHRVLEWLAEMGTKNIILSGGEPLAHPDITVILDSAKTFGMHVGILSSGVSRTGVIEDIVVNKIAELNAWVQVSIDSFNPEKYREIRSVDLSTCIESVRCLSKRGVPVQICYTIQKENVEEIITGSVFDACKEMLPPDVEVRFKLAHGFGGDFLVSEEQLNDVVVQLSANTENRYLEEMLAKGYFTYEGIGQGLPAKDKMSEYKNSEFTCHALDLTMFIDSNGDVYPCCYLFDDNVGQSPYRSEYKLGSLRSAASRVVPSIQDSKFNPIKQLWVGQKLNTLRATKLPIEQHACGKCTRHIHQNDLLNRLQNIFDEYEERESSLAQEVQSRTTKVSNGMWV